VQEQKEFTEEKPVEKKVEKEVPAEVPVKQKPNGMWAALTSAMSKKIGVITTNEKPTAPKEETPSTE
jgi:hypothetical protein